MLSIPKTIIIGIYLHGELHLKKNGSLRKDIVPNNMNVRIINGVATNWSSCTHYILDNLGRVSQK